jgi:hypothetical protein
MISNRRKGAKALSFVKDVELHLALKFTFNVCKPRASQNGTPLRHRSPALRLHVLACDRSLHLQPLNRNRIRPISSPCLFHIFCQRAFLSPSQARDPEKKTIRHKRSTSTPNNHGQHRSSRPRHRHNPSDRIRSTSLTSPHNLISAKQKQNKTNEQSPQIHSPSKTASP